MAIYPQNIKIFTTHRDVTDVVYAAHMNEAQDEIAAIQSILGTNPNGPYATVKAYIEAVKADSAPASHNHDSRYYTRSALDTALAGKSNVGHTHAGMAHANHNHDDRYSRLSHNHDGYHVKVTGDTMTGPLRTPDGSASAPGLAIGAADTGAYRVSIGNAATRGVYFTYGGTVRFSFRDNNTAFVGPNRILTTADLGPSGPIDAATLQGFPASHFATAGSLGNYYTKSETEALLGSGGSGGSASTASVYRLMGA